MDILSHPSPCYLYNNALTRNLPTCLTQWHLYVVCICLQTQMGFKVGKMGLAYAFMTLETWSQLSISKSTLYTHSFKIFPEWPYQWEEGKEQHYICCPITHLKREGTSAMIINCNYFWCWLSPTYENKLLPSGCNVLFYLTLCSLKKSNCCHLEWNTNFKTMACWVNSSQYSLAIAEMPVPVAVSSVNKPEWQGCKDIHLFSLQSPIHFSSGLTQLKLLDLGQWSTWPLFAGCRRRRDNFNLATLNAFHVVFWPF